jgi:hypothetical protein
VPVDYITIRHTFTFAHKLDLKKPPFNWLVLASSKEIVSTEKALDGDAVFVMFVR